MTYWKIKNDTASFRVVDVVIYHPENYVISLSITKLAFDWFTVISRISQDLHLICCFEVCLLMRNLLVLLKAKGDPGI